MRMHSVRSAIIVAFMISFCVEIATGSTSGTVIAWGANDRGQCAVPPPNEGYVAADGASIYSIGLLADSSLVVWTSDDLYGISILPEPNADYIAVSAGSYHWLALKSNGSIVEQPFIETIPQPNSGFIAVAAGAYHSLGLKSNGMIVAWGEMEYGETYVPAPNADFVAVDAQGFRSLGLKADGSVVSWGEQGGALSRPPDPELVAVSLGGGHCLGLRADGSIMAWGTNVFGQCNVPAPNTNFVAVAAGQFHSLGLKADGSIVAWGYNYSGQCDVPLPNTDFMAVAAGTWHSIGLSGGGSCMQVKGPIAPYQSIYEVDDITTMELRNENLPQAANLSIELDPACRCSNGEAVIRATKLIPSSGTGRVFNVFESGAYFLIDNMTSQGSYDLEIECAGGSTDTTSANFNYAGFMGYTPEATLHNSLSGNVIRGAGVSLWQWNGTGYNLYRSAIAGDGTYAFGNLPTGEYKILIEYELDGQQWRGPYVVDAKRLGSIPYEDVYLVPVTNDTEAPIVESVGDGEVRIIDGGVGLSVVEAVVGETDNLNVYVSKFSSGADTVVVDYVLVDRASGGSGRLLCVDQLGNYVEQEIALLAVTNVDEQDPGRARMGFLGGYPNPFNPRTLIVYELPVSGAVDLSIFDAQGRLVRRLAQPGILVAGRHETVWDGRSDGGAAMPSGVYFCRLLVGDYIQTTKLALLK